MDQDIVHEIVHLKIYLVVYDDWYSIWIGPPQTCGIEELEISSSNVRRPMDGRPMSGAPLLPILLSSHCPLIALSPFFFPSLISSHRCSAPLCYFCCLSLSTPYSFHHFPAGSALTHWRFFKLLVCMVLVALDFCGSFVLSMYYPSLPKYIMATMRN